MTKFRPIRRLLVANRSEIAIRVFRAASELGIETVAIYSREDRFALHRFKADESYLVGAGKGPLQAYLDIDEIIRVAQDAGVDAIHPGYGFLSENPEFAERCAVAGLIFIGPSPDVMRTLGNKVVARHLAVKAKAPVMPATGPLPREDAEVQRLAAEVGFPLMLKASWGGGGRGMRVIEDGTALLESVATARREALNAFGNDEVYLEKLVRRARHVEVQILGDHYGNLVHLFERDCSVQRRNQKVVERAPAPYLSTEKRQKFCDAALSLAREAGYVNAGTVEFLMDMDSEDIYFIEVNPRIQVEHTVTEVVTGIDIVKAQIRIAEGLRIGDQASGVPGQDDIRLTAHALQCRITTEDPENNFIPDYGKITAYRGATGFGIRLDGGTAYSGALITRYYDSLLEKVTAWGNTPDEALARMDRALREFRIRGVSTNLQFVEGLLRHPDFRNNIYTTRFIDETPELFQLPKRRDRASRLLRFIGDVLVNENSEVKDRARPGHLHFPVAPPLPQDSIAPVQMGPKQILEREGAVEVARWMREQDRLLITDTTFRDAHQSLLATRVRTDDLVRIAPFVAHALPELFSVECWGGATFDVAMRFLKECPWDRLFKMRAAMPNHLLQMLLRGSNAVGYKNYPDNVVRYFVDQAARGGIDLFRVFDSLNWVDNMRVAMDAVCESGKICEAVICYTGDLLDPTRPRYDLKYYLTMARELEAAGAHILGIKDMAGLLKPEAARVLITALKQEIGLPIHLHTHDTSGISAATLLATADVGVDAIDACIDSMSGLTSQPNLGSIAAALRHTPRDSGLDREALLTYEDYWAQVRANYAAFESDIRCGTSDVYHHEMPGGQYTNLRQQARSLGIEDNWPDVSNAYADVNRLFGDIVKVTPSSKVVGDMALMMVTSGLTCKEVEDPGVDVAFPDSVVSFFRGDLGQPVGGFPQALQNKVLKGEKPLTARPGALLPPADLAAERAQLEQDAGRAVTDFEFASALMYPDVFADYLAQRAEYGDLSVLPTPIFFYGMQVGDELAIDIDRGKTLIIRFYALSEPDDEGLVTVFFELNGQPRTVKVRDRSRQSAVVAAPKIDDGNPDHLGAPMPGLIATLVVKQGQAVKRGDTLMTIEAMKMQTAVLAEKDGVIEQLLVQPGSKVETKDLLAVIADA